MQLLVRDVKRWLEKFPDDAEVHSDVYKHNKRRELLVVRDFDNGKASDTDLTLFLSENLEEE